MPTSLLVRAVTTAMAALLVMTASACGPYYPGPNAPRPERTVEPSARQVQAQAQTQVQGSVVPRSQSRRELEAQANQLDRQGRGAEAAAIRARLRDGDFNIGDAIVINVVNVPQFSDTFPVRSGRTLQLPELAPIPLTGILRTELTPHLQRHIGRYVINPVIEAHSLVRVAVAGAVARPGFYEVRPDAPLSEAVMSAGGFAREADATKVSLRRAGRVVVPESALRQSVAMGATLDDLNVRPGDELRVGERARRNWLEVARTAAYVIVMATGLWATGRF